MNLPAYVIIIETFLGWGLIMKNMITGLHFMDFINVKSDALSEFLDKIIEEY